MRRIVLILIGLVALGALLPAAPAAAAPMPHHGHAMPPGHCGDEGQGAIHLCLGCAVDPEPAAAVVATFLSATPVPIARLVTILADHRPGFDPPPPRADG